MSSLALVRQTLSCCFNIGNLHKKVHSLHILPWCKMWTFSDVTWHRKTTATLGALWAQKPLWALENGDLNPISNFCSLTFRRRVSRLLLRCRVRAMSRGNWLLKCKFLKRHILSQIEVFFFRWSYRLIIMSFHWTWSSFALKPDKKMGVVYWCPSSYIAAVTLARQPTETSAYVQLTSISHLQLRFLHLHPTFWRTLILHFQKHVASTYTEATGDDWWWLLFLNWVYISEGYISTTVPSNSVPRGKGHWTMVWQGPWTPLLMVKVESVTLCRIHTLWCFLCIEYTGLYAASSALSHLIMTEIAQCCIVLLDEM